MLTRRTLLRLLAENPRSRPSHSGNGLGHVRAVGPNEQSFRRPLYQNVFLSALTAGVSQAVVSILLGTALLFHQKNIGVLKVETRNDAKA